MMLITRLPLPGMVHLHSLNPPLIHMNFSTMKVVLGEDSSPKVADVGIHSLLNRIDGAASSSRMSEDDPFLDPELLVVALIRPNEEMFQPNEEMFFLRMQ